MGIMVESVGKSYEGRKALEGISLDIEDGSFYTLLGGSQSGKTTLLRIMVGIEAPSVGKVYYDGEDVTMMPVQERSVAMVYQQFVNYPSLTIYENIASPMRVSRKKYSRNEIDKKVGEISEMLGLSHVLTHFPEEVSGGQQQRTAIARALAKEARFTFLDEPLANLDYKLREELRGELKAILRRKGGVVVYATPDPVDALSMATHVGYIQEGKILQSAPLATVYDQPAMADVGRYFSYPAMNITSGKLVEENGKKFLRIYDQAMIDMSEYKDLLNDTRYLVGIRAYDLFTGKEGAGYLPLDAKVDFSEELGSDTEVYLKCNDERLVILMQKFYRQPSGTEVGVFFDPGRLFVFESGSGKLLINTAQKS